MLKSLCSKHFDEPRQSMALARPPCSSASRDTREFSRFNQTPCGVAFSFSQQREMLQAIPTTRLPERRARPRVSLVLVLPSGQPVLSEPLTARLRSFGEQASNVIVACAGTTSDLDVLESVASSAQFLLAPADTTVEGLRELAIQFAPGDIVTLLDDEQTDARSGADFNDVAAR